MRSSKPLFISLIFLFLLMNFYPLSGDDRSTRVDQLFEKWNKENTPGAAVAIIHNGKLTFKNAYGMANLEHRIPLRTNSVFNIGSVSKQFTAFCIALLEKEGKINIEDDVRKYIPKLPDYGKRIKLRHLVYHTSGLRDHQMLIYLGGMDVGKLHSPEKVVTQILCRQKNLSFDPGEKYAYSNSGYLLLGEVVRRASGLSLREYAQKMIFKPLGMDDSFYHNNFRSIINDRAWSYYPDGKGGYLNYIDRYDLVGDSGVYTTVEDLVLWDQNVYKASVGVPEMITKILSPGRLDNGETINYSYGLEHDTYKGLKIVRHDGIWGGYGAMILRFPVERFTVVCLSNNMGEIDTRRMCFQIADIYLEDSYIKKRKDIYQIISLPKAKLKQMAGYYRSPSNGNLMKVSRREGSLICEVNYFFKAEYAPIGQMEFKSIKPDIPSVFRFMEKNDSSDYIIHTFRNDEKTNIYEPIELFAPNGKELLEYNGNYYSEELDNTYSFHVEEGKLFIHYEKSPNRAPRGFLKPTIKDEFAAWPSVYHFRRNAKDEIIAFTLGTDLKRGISFIKIK